MLKPLSAFAALAVLVATAALAEPQVNAPIAAQSEAAALAPVDTMTCEQMQAEMTGAGQQMHNQLDPQFGVEAQAMAQEAQEKQRQAQQQAMNPTCFIPVIGMVCAVQQQHQAQQSQQDAAANQQRMQAQMDRLNTSMAGIDQQRMMAMSNRFQAQHCQTPQ
jgi:hypothetical protein